MIRIVTKSLLIICLITLDILLILSIYRTHQITNSITQAEIKVPKKEVAGASIKAVRVLKPVKFKVKTVIVKVTPKPNISPTIKQATSMTSSPINAPTAAPVVYPGTGDLLQQVNSFRAGKGLSPFTSNSETCFFANIRAQEISTAFNHDGFNNRVNAKSLPYPSYTSVAENIAENSNSNAVVQAWIDSPGHNANLSKDVPYACVVGNGRFYVFEAWRP